MSSSDEDMVLAFLKILTGRSGLSSDIFFRKFFDEMRFKQPDSRTSLQKTENSAIDAGLVSLDMEDLRINLDAEKKRAELFRQSKRKLHRDLLSIKRRNLELATQLTRVLNEKSDVEDRFALLADQYQEISTLVTGIYKRVDILKLSGKVSEQTKKPELQSEMREIQKLINAFDNKK